MVKGDGPAKDAAPAGDGDPHRHLSTLPGWREFTALAPGQPELLAAAEYASLGDDARAAYDEERLDYHTRLGVVGTSVLRQVVTAGRRLTLLNRQANRPASESSARRSGRPARARANRSRSADHGSTRSPRSSTACSRPRCRLSHRSVSPSSASTASSSPGTGQTRSPTRWCANTSAAGGQSCTIGGFPRLTRPSRTTT
jgi:hypothetical protein